MQINSLIHATIVSDYSAIAHYRLIFPEMRARTMSHSLRFIESSHYLGDPNVYRLVRTVKMQRPYTKTQFGFLKDFLKPLSERYGFWIIMDVDDCLVYEDIPAYNIARETYNGEVLSMLKKSMEMVDFVTTTTPFIRDYYVDKFGLPIEKFIVIPNYLPRWWIGNCFNLNETIYHFDENARNGKLKIAFVCGGNHFDLNNVNGGVDDFTHIVQWISDSSEDFEFHFVGGVPQQLKELVASGVIKTDPGVDVLNYPREIYDRHYNMWICPLQDNVFNKCKSNIKLIEAWSLGIPILVQKCECYTRYTPDVFDTADELDNMVRKLISDRKSLVDRVITGRRIVENGDNHSPNGWWMEKNMDAHMRIYHMQQKTMQLDMGKVNIDA